MKPEKSIMVSTKEMWYKTVNNNNVSKHQISISEWFLKDPVTLKTAEISALHQK